MRNTDFRIPRDRAYVTFEISYLNVCAHTRRPSATNEAKLEREHSVLCLFVQYTRVRDDIERTILFSITQVVLFSKKRYVFHIFMFFF